MTDYVTIARYTYQYEYSVLKLMLKEANIPFFFKNETMASITPFYSNALGGIELLVHPDAVADATDLIKKLNEDNEGLRLV